MCLPPRQRRVLTTTFITQRFSTTLVMKIAYGYQIVSDDDDYIRIAENISIAGNRSGTPGMAPPDLIPIRMFSPAIDIIAEH